MLNYSLDRVVDNMPCAVLVLNSESDIIYGNLLAAQYADKSLEELVGLRGGSAFKCIHVNDVPQGCGYGPHCRLCPIRNMFKRTLKSHINVSAVEVVMNFTDKGERVLTVNTVYLSDDNIVIMALNDITKMKELEKVRLEKERLAAAILTSGGVCHEMNQPLTAVNGYIEMSLMDIDENSPAYENLTTALSEMNRLRRISRNLMNINSFVTREYLGKGSYILDIERSSKKNDPEIIGS